MHTRKLLVITAATSALALPQLSFADCSHYTEIRNNSNVTMHIVELKSAIEGGWFKSQWSGDRSIAAGGKTTLNWTSDYACQDPTGANRRFNVKLFRKDGSVHECGTLGQNQGVKVDVPDLCFPN